MRNFELNRVELVKDCFQIEADRVENDLWIIPIKVIRAAFRDSQITTQGRNSNTDPSTNKFACVSISDWHRCFAHQTPLDAVLIRGKSFQQKVLKVPILCT